VLGSDYLVTARAKGLSARTVVLRHGLKNALIPVVTVIGLQLGALLSGAVLTETVFGRVGVGRYVLNAITARDYPVVQATVIVVALFVVVISLVVDLVYAILDPRSRAAGDGGRPPPRRAATGRRRGAGGAIPGGGGAPALPAPRDRNARSDSAGALRTHGDLQSEEHTSELQSFF